MCHNFREVQTICSRTDPFDFQLVEYGPSALLGPLVNSSQLNPYTTDKPADTRHVSAVSENRPMRPEIQNPPRLFGMIRLRIPIDEANLLQSRQVYLDMLASREVYYEAGHLGQP